MTEQVRKEYTVSWTVQVDAQTAEEAAQDVRDTFFRHGIDATIFEVRPSSESHENSVIIDTAEFAEANCVNHG